MIAPSTRRLVDGLFEFADLVPRKLEGFAEAVAAWRVLGPRGVGGRFEARRAAGLTPLVGREEEFALLLRGWEQAKDGEGQVILLCGEPGIGKSRIVQTLRERLADDPHLSLRCRCSHYRVNSALYPVIDQLKRAARFQREDTAGTKLAKLQSLLRRATEEIAEHLDQRNDAEACPHTFTRAISSKSSFRSWRTSG